MIEKRIYLGGEFVDSDTFLEITCSYSGSVIGKTWLADESHIEMAVHKAGASRMEFDKLSHYQRSEILKEIANAIEERLDPFAEVISLEASKPLRYSKAEVRRAINTIQVASEEAKRLPMEYMRLDWIADAKGKEGLVKYFPAGIVAGIAPFNFPLNLAVHKVAPAIAAGCPIILKPASSTPLSALMLAEVIDKTELPKGAFSVLPCTRKAGNLLVTHPGISVLSFTGSPDVGWEMKKNAGKKKVILELGGNAAAIVCPSANLKHAVNRCIVGAFAYQGQVCIHTQRIFVHKDIYKEFCNDFVAIASKLAPGSPLDISTDICPMIDESNAIRVEKWIYEAKKDGAEILLGGKREKAFLPPTVLTNTNPGMKVNFEEVFGPLVTIEAYSNFQEAVESVNDSRFGLQAAVFTNQIDEMDMAFDQIHTGGVIINDATSFRADHMPYGGIKDSGAGREGIKYAIHDYLEPKILVKNFFIP